MVSKQLDLDGEIFEFNVQKEWYELTFQEDKFHDKRDIDMVNYKILFNF
jgi:hypothetical protein